MKRIGKWYYYFIVHAVHWIALGHTSLFMGHAEHLETFILDSLHEEFGTN